MSHRLSYTLSREELPRDGGETACQLQIHPDDTGRGELPLHVVFCVDSSYSMRGGDIEAAKEGVESAVEHLSSDDQFGVVEFDDDAAIVADPVAGNRYGRVSSSVDGIEADGNTNIMDGLEKSRQLLDKMRGGGGFLSSGSTDAVEWILLISDGQPNRTNESAFKRALDGLTMSTAEKHGAAAADLSDEGITVHTAGVGSGYDPAVNEAISDAAGGTMEHKSSGRGIGDFFEGQIRDARSVVATNPTLTLRPDNGASLDNVMQELPTKIKDPNVERRGGELVVDVPDLNVDDPPQFSFDIDVPAEANPVAHAELDVDGDTATASIEVGFASAALVKDEVNEGVLENRDAITHYEDRKDSMSAEQRAEEKSSGITRE